MPVDPELLRTARDAQGRLVDAERATDIARADFHHAVRRLHLAGGSLREIADAFGLSHQRVHQIVEDAVRPKGWRSATFRSPGTEAPWASLECSFCGKAQKQVAKLIAGPGVYICDECVALADGVVTTGADAATPISEMVCVAADLTTATCGFCLKKRHQVAGLAAAAQAAICTECLELCHEIITDELA